MLRAGVTQIYATDKDRTANRFSWAKSTGNNTGKRGFSHEIPEIVKDATVAIEDNAFYEHRGVDPGPSDQSALSECSDRPAWEGGVHPEQQSPRNIFLTKKEDHQP